MILYMMHGRKEGLLCFKRLIFHLITNVIEIEYAVLETGLSFPR